MTLNLVRNHAYQQLSLARPKLVISAIVQPQAAGSPWFRVFTAGFKGGLEPIMSTVLSRTRESGCA